ncbi:hypothetical protein HPG69_013224 [Diceros bicornis minor]|uniref:Dynein axonemal light chain 1 n=1 Tax=Diceros bicornis minor TaxID=77932 RepID=A0A7J7F4B0_DICBM|nr:hypothetical protein HPG69_013224 [Diceros bicornis minor]
MEEKTSQKPSEAKEIKLYAQIPPIEKMDASLSTLANCEKLEDIVFRKKQHKELKWTVAILSSDQFGKRKKMFYLAFLMRKNSHTAFSSPASGQEAVGDTLEELWISYNFIEKLKGIHVMKKLKILYMSNNLVKDWAEFVKLAELPCLEDLVFVGNPLEEKHSAEGNWIEEATKRVPKLKKLDGE